MHDVGSQGVFTRNVASGKRSAASVPVHPLKTMIPSNLVPSVSLFSGAIFHWQVGLDALSCSPYCFPASTSLGKAFFALGVKWWKLLLCCTLWPGPPTKICWFRTSILVFCFGLIKRGVHHLNPTLVRWIIEGNVPNRVKRLFVAPPFVQVICLSLRVFLGLAWASRCVEVVPSKCCAIPLNNPHRSYTFRIYREISQVVGWCFAHLPEVKIFWHDFVLYDLLQAG